MFGLYTNCFNALLFWILFKTMGVYIQGGHNVVLSYLKLNAEALLKLWLYGKAYIRKLLHRP